MTQCPFCKRTNFEHALNCRLNLNYDHNLNRLESIKIDRKQNAEVSQQRKLLQENIQKTISKYREVT